MTPTDSDLVQRCLIHDETASFGELVLRHQSAVRGFLRHLTGGDHAWADDLAQETFIRAHRDLRRFRGASRLETWLLGIAYNLFRNDRRRRREALMDEHTPEPAAPETGRLSDLHQDLAAAMARLSDDQQLALRLSLHHSLTHEEIASTTGWPLGTVKTHIARGKDQVREMLLAWRIHR